MLIYCANRLTDFDYNWLTKEMNTNLPQELNFKVEASNLLKCKDTLSNLIKKGDVAVPDICEVLRLPFVRAQWAEFMASVPQSEPPTRHNFSSSGVSALS